ncbi:MAG: DUF4493 domain-containing protein [Bacteroides sp.]
MKRYQLPLAALLGMTLFTSCEMRDELWSNDKDNRSQGIAALSISVKQPYSMTTRAEGETSSSNVSTDDFPVIIQGTSSEVQDIKKEYAKVSEMPATIGLPVGTYSVSSHTPGEISKKMTSPYYAGAQEMIITKGVTSQTEVKCKMKNSRIQVNYGDDFKQNFTSWTMTIEDGSENAMAYTQEDLNPTAVYWYFGEEAVTTITVNIRATTTAGNTVSESRSFKKADAAEQYGEENDYFEGGDAVEIQMGAVAASSGNVTGIAINSYVTFEDKTEQVEIPVNIPVSINEPSGNSYLISGITIDENSYPDNVALLIKAEAGLQHLYCKIGSDNSSLTSAASAYTSEDGLDLIGATESTATTFFGTLPTSGATEYTLTLQATLMQLLQQHAGTHTLTVKATDVNGNPMSKILNVTVTKSQEPEPPVEDETPKATYTDEEGNDLFQTGIAFTTKGPYPTAQTISIKTPKGLKSMLVTIEAGNEGFQAAVEEMRFTNRELVGDTALEELLTGLGLAVSMPVANATSYDFPIGTFYSLMDIYGSTDSDKSHVFKIKVIDNNDQSIDVALSVTINPQTTKE